MNRLLLFFAFMFLGFALKAQTNFINETQTISVTNEYVDDVNMTWNVQSSNTQKPLLITYKVNTEYSYDLVKIYSVDESNNSKLVMTLSGNQSGTVSTIVPNGKAIITFTSDEGGNYAANPQMYAGLNIKFAIDNNVYPSNTVSDNFTSGSTIVNGNLGVGVLNPSYKLEVNGTAKLKGNLVCYNSIAFQNNAQFTVTNTDVPNMRSDNPTFQMPQYGMAAPATNGGADLWIAGFTGIKMFSGGVSKPALAIIPSGNIGIGTINPQNALDVKGTIRATEVKVESVDKFADFVFEEGYQLPSLETVEQHIKENGHLSEIPSAKEVKENGMSLVDMQVKLLQKVEEMTLYIIQQQKEIEALKAEMKTMKR